MLLERCEPGVMLQFAPESEQDAVITTPLKRLWRNPASPSSRPARDGSACASLRSRHSSRMTLHSQLVRTYLKTAAAVLRYISCTPLQLRNLSSIAMSLIGITRQANGFTSGQAFGPSQNGGRGGSDSLVPF